MQQRFRNDYDGEFIILNTEYKDGKKVQNKEWIANPIQVDHISGRAVVIGSGTSVQNFPMHRLENHRGGLLESLKLQSYGTGDTWRKIKTNFYVEYDKAVCEQMIQSKYQESTIVYSSIKNLLSMPGEFYLIPYNVKLLPEATATYLAAFDNHSEIFLIGCDCVDEYNQQSVKKVNQILEVFETYHNKKFIIVDDSTVRVPKLWRKNKNVAVWNYERFISYCDI